MSPASIAAIPVAENATHYIRKARSHMALELHAPQINKSASTPQVLVFRPTYQVHQIYFSITEPTDQEGMVYR